MIANGFLAATIVNQVNDMFDFISKIATTLMFIGVIALLTKVRDYYVPFKYSISSASTIRG